MKEGHIFTEGNIGADYPEVIASQISNIGDVQKIIHHVSSPGGNVYAGYEGYHKLIALGIPIDTIIEGQAQSMATFVSMASQATGGKVKILNPSRWMIHNPKFNVEGLGSSGYADSNALQGGADELRKIETEMAEAYAAKTGKPIAEIQAMMKKETYMTAKEAVEFGFADEVIDILDRQMNNKLKAVAMGETGQETKTKVMKKEKGILAKIGELFIKAEEESTAVAVDIPLQDGGVLVVDGDAPAEGMNAMFNGQPADGEYVLATGETVTCAGGVITSVMPAQTAQTAQESEAQKAARLLKENEQLKQQLAQKAQAEEAAKQAQQQQLAAEQVKKVEAEKAKVAEALAAKEKELAELKKQTVGDPNKQGEGMTQNRVPVGFGGRTSEDKLKIKASRTFLADHFQWLERNYEGGKYADGTRFMDYRTGGPEAVSILETNLSYTWPGVLSTDLFFKPTMDSPALSDIFTVDLGSADSKQYHIAPTASKVLKPYTGCSQPVTGSNYDITSKKIQIKPFQMFESWCVDDFTQQLTGVYNVLAQDWLKTGNEKFDPAGTPIDRMIMQILKDALRRDVFRRVSFADKDSSSADWNQFDGLWPNLIDQAGASNYCVYRETSVTLGTGALAAGAALNLFAAMYNNSDPLLKQEGITKKKAQFLVTRSIWENYYTSLAANGAVTEQAFGNLVDGAKPLTFRGIPVVPIDIWDAELNDSTNPLAATTQHLAAFTIKDNHILGVQDTGDLGSIKSWFSDDDNVRYYRANMNMGFIGAIHCNLTTIAY